MSQMIVNFEPFTYLYYLYILYTLFIKVVTIFSWVYLVLNSVSLTDLSAPGVFALICCVCY